MYIFYTDGACSFNDKKKISPGAFAIIGYKNEIVFTKYSCFFSNTTSNRMELSAVIYTLENFYMENMIIKSDSKYVVDGFYKWRLTWKKNNWYNSKKIPVLNQDLWKKLEEVTFNKSFSLIWIKGHKEEKGNLEVDFLAKKTIENYLKKNL